jgi:hypothetical protein
MLSHHAHSLRYDLEAEQMSRFTNIAKALAIMLMAGLGGAAIGQGIRASKDGGEVGVGTFVLVGALFLYRMWFGNHAR